MNARPRCGLPVATRCEYLHRNILKGVWRAGRGIVVSILGVMRVAFRGSRRLHEGVLGPMGVSNTSSDSVLGCGNVTWRSKVSEEKVPDGTSSWQG